MSVMFLVRADLNSNTKLVLTYLASFGFMYRKVIRLFGANKYQTAGDFLEYKKLKFWRVEKTICFLNFQDKNVLLKLQ